MKSEHAAGKHFYRDPAQGLPELPGGVRSLHGRYDGHGRRFALAAARFNLELTGPMVTTAVETLLERGVRGEDVVVAWVPGSFELPAMLKHLHREYAPHALIPFGVVVEGETRHAELIMSSVTESFGRLSLELDTPVIDSVVHAYTLEAAEARCLEGERNRGAYAALAALEMVSLR